MSCRNCSCNYRHLSVFSALEKNQVFHSSQRSCRPEGKLSTLRDLIILGPVWGLRNPGSRSTMQSPQRRMERSTFHAMQPPQPQLVDGVSWMPKPPRGLCPLPCRRAHRHLLHQAPVPGTRDADRKADTRGPCPPACGLLGKEGREIKQNNSA